jgi:hypothetical protein
MAVNAAINGSIFALPNACFVMMMALPRLSGRVHQFRPRASMRDGLLQVGHGFLVHSWGALLDE